MDEGRFESLGRGIYRTFETDPKDAGEIQKNLLEALKGMEKFLEAQLPQKMKETTDVPPAVAKTRELVVEDIRDEIKWTKEAIAWFGWGEKRKEVFDLDQWEADKATGKK